MAKFDIYSSLDLSRKLLTVSATDEAAAKRKACNGMLGVAYIDTRTVEAVPAGSDPKAIVGARNAIETNSPFMLETEQFSSGMLGGEPPRRTELKIAVARDVLKILNETEASLRNLRPDDAHRTLLDAIRTLQPLV